MFSLGSFPEVGQKQKTEKKKEDWTMVRTMASYALPPGPKVGENNGPLRFRPPSLVPGGACKPPGPKYLQLVCNQIKKPKKIIRACLVYVSVASMIHNMRIEI